MAADEQTRRDFLKFAGARAAGLGVAAYTLHPLGKIAYNLATGKSETHAAEHHHSHGLEKWIDYAGSSNFGWGIWDLAKKGDLNGLNYPAAAGLLAAKYRITDDNGKEHITKELGDGLDALRIILGTTIAAEGIDMNLDAITNQIYQRDSTLEEKLFMLATVSPIASSLSTTVGNSTVFRDEVENLVESVLTEYASNLDEHASDREEKIGKLRKDLYADLIAHVSDNSGFMFLGDPPFIAMVQKYGTEGFKYQNMTMWAPMLYSSARLLVKMSKHVNRDENISLIDNVDQAMKILFNKEHGKLFLSVMGDSALNIGRVAYNFTGDNNDVMAAQDPRGIMFNTHAFDEKAISLGKFGLEYMKSLGIATEQGLASNVLDHFTPRHIKHGLHHHVGENMADVLSVFPFQAMSIPFLQTAFNDYLHILDKMGLPQEVKDAAVYLSIAAFSTLADNYVACKIGLDLYPEKPEIPLVAAIIGGSLLPPGNMANMTLVSLDKYGIGDGLDGARTLRKNWDMIGAGYAYAKAIPLLRKVPFLGKLYDNSGLIKALERAT